MEGLEPDLPEMAKQFYSPFMTRIIGFASLSSALAKGNRSYDEKAGEVIIDGKRYEWVDFEN